MADLGPRAANMTNSAPGLNLSVPNDDSWRINAVFEWEAGGASLWRRERLRNDPYHAGWRGNADDQQGAFTPKPVSALVLPTPDSAARDARAHVATASHTASDSKVVGFILASWTIRFEEG